MRSSRDVLCVARFPTNTGYAWDFIEAQFAGIAETLAPLGIVTWVAYPSVGHPPATLEGSPARWVELPVELGSPSTWRALLGFIRSRRIGTVYLADHPGWHPAMPLLRIAGVERIVVHDHSSGDPPVPRGTRRFLKWLSRSIPGTMADAVVAVSQFVATRNRLVDLIPDDRVTTIWNAIPQGDEPAEPAGLRERFGLPPARPLVVCVARAAPHKGVQHLFRAFDIVWSDWRAPERPILVYIGAGPYEERLRRVRAGLAAREDIFMLGYVSDASSYLGSADLCVVPSIWAEAFGLAALEPMVRGVPVIASRAGGIPEVVVDGETGLLVEPGDEAGLAGAIRRLLLDPALRSELGERGRARARALFDFSSNVSALAGVLVPGLPEGPHPAGRPARHAPAPSRQGPNPAGRNFP